MTPNPSLDKPIELKACPFCGEGANLDCIEQQVFVGCADLECLGGWVNKPHLTNAEAIAAWNTRAEASQLAGVVGERIAAALDASGNDELVEAITQSVVRHVWNVPPGPSWPVVTSVRKGVRAAISRTQERSNG